MRSNLSVRSKLLIAVTAAVLLAHGSTPLANPRVRALGQLFQCQCGCEASVTDCYMINCHSSDPIRAELLSMVEAGKTDKEITDVIVAEYGIKILRKPPTEGFFLSAWVMPFAAAGAGLALVTLVLRYLLAKKTAIAAAPAGEAASDPALDKYREQIEKELGDID